MTKLIDLTEKTFGRLTVISAMPIVAGKRRRWLCRCECGKIIERAGTDLTSGDIRSCGCFRSEATTARLKRHGLSGTKVHRAWCQMRRRCEDPTNADYHRYGGRGIAVCERWQSFDNFFADMGQPPTSLHSIDRIDNDKGYQPGNCRWITSAEQARNQERNVYVEINGVRKVITDWCAITGVNPFIAASRIRIGWDPIKAVTFKGDGRHTRGRNGSNPAPVKS